MHTNEKREDPLVEMGYEVRDVNLKVLNQSVIGFFIFTFAMIFISWGVLFGFRIGPFQTPAMNLDYANKQSGYNAVRKVPQAPNPVLQTNVSAKTDMMDMRQAEASRLEGTGYLDASKERVHIPIDRAIELLAERGLPSTADAPAITRGNDDSEMRVNTGESVADAQARMNAAENAAVDKYGPAGGGTNTPTATPPANSKPAASDAGHSDGGAH
ncbi:MAG: hypothetical protein SFX74_02645 [Fimbriimonadaceae bacterium]|nr:hypothetical protein [Fimbriimonadaceae bacterium]